jgi:hypothetical protein
MPTEEVERLHYFQRQYLGAEDFEAQQAYHRDMRRRHNLGPHIWGIVVGLELVERPAQGAGGGVDVFVQPGMAIDGYGREIFVFGPVALDPALFEGFASAGHLDVWIAYDEENSRRAQPGFEECDGPAFQRIREAFRFVIKPGPQTHGPIVVDGSPRTPPPPANPDDLTIPADESVPYQELPDEDGDPRWLVQLGVVNWDGVNRRFDSASPPERLFEGRRYLGVVAESVLSPAPQFRVAPRNLPADPDAADFAAVVGRLRVDGRLVAKRDVLIHGGKLAFQNTAGLDENVPLWLKRRPDELRIHTGEPNSAARLTIGPGPADESAEKPVLAVTARDTVDIATGTLQFGSQTRQMMNLFSTNYGIGVQNNTLYQRTDFDFCWFKGGSHKDGRSDPGGGTLLMKLDESANLTLPGNAFFGAQTRQMLNLWQTLYGVGVQDNTLYFRTGSDFCWFRGGVHDNSRSNPGGGALVMKLADTGELSVPGTLVATNAVVTGTLSVQGAQNVVKVQTFTRAVRNAGRDIPATWSIAFAGFAEVYSAFAVLQGYSLWDYNGDTQFAPDPAHHSINDDAIPQHVFVRVDQVTTGFVQGVAYASESNGSVERDNTILFTVVVIGRGF